MDAYKIKAVVTRSNCPHYAVNDAIFFDGPLIDKAQSGNLCMMAVNAIFPYVYAARKGCIQEGTLQCPDCEDSVAFVLRIAE